MATQCDTPQPSNYPQIDTSKRYDVYCQEMGVRIVVYRKALFKGVSRLLSTQKFEIAGEFLELEQANGQTVYVSRMSVIKFCEPGSESSAEEVASK